MLPPSKAIRASSGVVWACAALAAAVLGPALAAPDSTSPGKARVATVLSEESGAIVLRLEAPATAWETKNGYLYPASSGLGLTRELGRPEVPVVLERVGIPEGAQPVLTILESDSALGPTGRIGPVPRFVPVDPGSDERTRIDEEDETVYGTDAWYPAEAPVRLGQVGALREQPFVELIFTPVLHNAAQQSSRIYKSVTVRIDFGGAPLASSVEPDDPDFENVYQSGLVNARQARGFRGRARSAEKELESETDAALTEPGTFALRVISPIKTLAPVSAKYKLTINKNAIYRLTPAWVGSNAPDLLSQNPSKYRMDCLGQQIPITVVDANTDGTFNGSDYIEFYGQALTWDILSPDEWDSGDYTDNNVYWLYADSAAVVRAATRASAPTSGYTIPGEFADTSHHEVDRRFVLQVPADGLDHWYEEPPINATGGVPDSKTFTVATPGVSTTTPTASVKVRLLGDNYVNNYHRSTILVNGATVSGPVDWSGFTEFTQGPATFSQSMLSDGTPETTSVTVSLPLGCSPNPCPSRDTVYENWIEITYGRKFRVDTDADGDGTVLNDQTLTFTVPNQNTQFHVTGFTQNVAAIYEITKTLSGTPLVDPVRLTNAQVTGAAAPFSFDFQIAFDGTLPAQRQFIVSTVTGGTTSGVLVPAAAEQDTSMSCPTYCVPNLHSPGTGADWLVIANASFLDSTPGSAWQQLLARRASQGLAVKVVDVKDVYDEFSYGISDPQAIRDFLAYVYASWPRPAGVPLRYAVLLGDASFDYKNGYRSPVVRNLLSSYMRSVSSSNILGWMSDETYFAAVSGADGLPDLFLGRFPVHSVAETNAVAQKILNYETGPTGQAWQASNLFIADDDDTAFELIQDNQIAYWLSKAPDPPCSLCTYPSSYEYHRVYERLLPGDINQKATEANDRIIRNMNGLVDPSRDIGPGSAIVSFVGHGSWQDWGSNQSFFHTSVAPGDDVDDLTNGSKLSVVLVADCLAGSFTITSKPGGCSNDATRTCLVNADCISPGTCTNPAPPLDLNTAYSEDMLATPNKGAVGIFAPSHVTFSNEHTVVLDRFFGDVYGPRKIRKLGALLAGIQLEFSAGMDTVGMQSYALFADPATDLMVPAPRPPASVTATPGNQQVSLSWTASPDAPVTYNVYQSTQPGGPYTRVAASISGTTFTATSLANCQPYYFFVTALKSGFEGAWSHFNDGCGTGGSCLKATPVSPAAPSAPTGVSATDLETGGSV